MHLFYDNSIISGTKNHSLNEEESKHACKVMRLKEGDAIKILNGKGTEFTGVINLAHAKHCEVTITEEFSEKNPNQEIHIAVAPTKMMERLEWFLEKSTEIGVTEISLILCANSERKIVKEERLEKILIAAMKQSKRLFLPKLNSLTPLKTFLENNPNGLIAHCEEDNKETISTIFKPTNCPILIGPEGDFNLEEIKLAKATNYKAISLGKNRLRTETAALFAVTEAQLLLNKF